MQFSSIVLFVLCASAVAAQEETRTFTFAHTQDPRHMQESVNMIRTLAEVRNASVDQAQRSLTVGGSPEQLALISWLFTETDQPASRPQTLQVRDTTFNDPRAFAVKILYPAHFATSQQVQEVINAVRSIAEVQRAIVLSGPGAIVIRANPEQVALAEWIVAELDRSMAGKRPTGLRDYSYPDTIYPPERRATAVRVYYPASLSTPQDIQEMVNGLRSMADVQRAVAFSTTGAVILRASPSQVELADWLVKDLDQTAGSGVREYRYAEGSVRSIPLPKEKDLEATVAKIREATGMRRVVALQRQRVIVMRGTPGQLAAAEPLMR